jgi:hypothetical protein
MMLSFIIALPFSIIFSFIAVSYLSKYPLVSIMFSISEYPLTVKVFLFNIILLPMILFPYVKVYSYLMMLQRSKGLFVAVEELDFKLR